MSFRLLIYWGGGGRDCGAKIFWELSSFSSKSISLRSSAFFAAQKRWESGEGLGAMQAGMVEIGTTSTKGRGEWRFPSFILSSDLIIYLHSLMYSPSPIYVVLIFLSIIHDFFPPF